MSSCTKIRHGIYGLALMFCVLCVLWGGQVRAQAAVIHPGSVWLDTGGHPIDAHGGSIVSWKGTYYWFGEARGLDEGSQQRFVNCYSSSDLAHWTFRRTVVALSDPMSLGKEWVLERPKVFVSSTGRFVMYAHIDDARYKVASVAVFVADAIDGEYHYQRSFRPLGMESRDIGQFVDDDGSAYLIFESRPSHGFYIAALSVDAMDVSREVSFLPMPLEGGALVHRGGRYYVMGSQLTGWSPNSNLYAVADSLSGPWSGFRDVASPDAKTYGSQSSLLFTVKGRKASSVIFMGDIWKPKDLASSTYLWMPLQIHGKDLQLPRPQPWTIDVQSGRVALVPAGDEVR